MLPARFPNLLVNGTTRYRRRYGNEYSAAQPAGGHRSGRKDHRQPDRGGAGRPNLEEIMEIVKGPDFPTGAHDSRHRAALRKHTAPARARSVCVR